MKPRGRVARRGCTPCCSSLLRFAQTPGLGYPPQVASLLRFALFSFSLLPFPVPQLWPQLHGRIPAVGPFTPCEEMQPGTVRCSAPDASRRGVEFLSSTFGFPSESAGEQSAESSPEGRGACKAPRSLQRKDALIAIQHRRVNKAPWFGARAGTAAAMRCLHGHTSSTNCGVQTGCAALARSARPSLAPAASWAQRGGSRALRSAGSSIRGLWEAAGMGTGEKTHSCGVGVV